MVMTGLIRSPQGDPEAGRAASDCEDRASPPLSQILWPFHRQRGRHREAPSRRSCGRDGPDLFQTQSGWAEVAPRRELAHQPGPRRQPIGADQTLVLDVGNGEVVDAVPRRNHRARQAGGDQDQRIAKAEPAESGPSRSSGQLGESRLKIVHEVKERLKPDQLHGLADASITHHHKAAFGVVALLSKLHQSAQTG